MTKKKTRKRNPRSERAMKAAVENRRSYHWVLATGRGDHKFIEVYRSYSNWLTKHDEPPIAIFDLRDCYRKRQPLTGITKRLRRAVRSKR